MENYRDSPLARFTTFWWGLALIFAFGIAAFGARYVLTRNVDTADDIRAAGRFEVRESVEADQATLLEAKDLGGGFVQLPAADVFPALVSDLVNKKPAAVKTKKQAIPGTKTHKRLNAVQPPKPVPAKPVAPANTPKAPNLPAAAVDVAPLPVAPAAE